MIFPYRLLFFYSLLTALALISTLPKPESSQAAVAGCPTPALSRFQRHKVARGETVESIAQRYHLMPVTIISMNPGLNNGGVTVGSELQIPPYNGIVVEVPRGQTWRQVAATYKVRADVLFEANGCQKNPRIVFVPGLNLSPSRLIAMYPQPNTPPVKIAGYPLQEITNVALGYGWQNHPVTGEVFFHSGMDLLATVGTPVEAIAPGTVVYANNQGSYGKLVIINHNGGLQSRYAQLEDIKVAVGQQVKKGEIIATVGTTGQPTSQQPHLHFEIRSSSSVGWVAEDPKNYLKR